MQISDIKTETVKVVLETALTVDMTVFKGNSLYLGNCPSALKHSLCHNTHHL